MMTRGCWIHTEQGGCASNGNRGEIPPSGQTTFKTAAFNRSATSPRIESGSWSLSRGGCIQQLQLGIQQIQQTDPRTPKDLWGTNPRQRGEVPVLASVWRAAASRSSRTGPCAGRKTHRRCLHGDKLSRLLRATGRTPRRAGHCHRPRRCNGMDDRRDGERLVDRASRLMSVIVADHSARKRINPAEANA